MDTKTFAEKLQAAGVTDDAIRATIVENFDLAAHDDELLELLFEGNLFVTELVSLAKCWAVPGFRQLNNDLATIGTALAQR